MIAAQVVDDGVVVLRVVDSGVVALLVVVLVVVVLVSLAVVVFAARAQTDATAARVDAEQAAEAVRAQAEAHGRTLEAVEQRHVARLREVAARADLLTLQDVPGPGTQALREMLLRDEQPPVRVPSVEVAEVPESQWRPEAER